MIAHDSTPSTYLNWDRREHRRAMLNSQWSPDSRLLIFDELHNYRLHPFSLREASATDAHSQAWEKPPDRLDRRTGIRSLSADRFLMALV